MLERVGSGKAGGRPGGRDLADPGMGKSRLLDEFLQSVRART